MMIYGQTVKNDIVEHKICEQEIIAQEGCVFCGGMNTNFNLTQLLD